MTVNEISTVCYVGAGTMGCYNSMVAAVCGYKVVLYDVDDNTLQQVPERHQEMAALLVGGGYCSEEDIPAALSRVLVVDDLAVATASADLVSESVSERLDIKREVHRELDQVCPARTILTTNASALLVSDIEGAVTRGDRFAALHSHLGAPLVDIVPGPRTDTAVIELLERYVNSLSGVPLVMKKEYPGYLLNAMLGPVIGTALALVATGVASIEEVDRAWMSQRRALMGPLGMMDYFGLNIALDSWEHGQQDASQEVLRPQVLALLRPYAERGELGMKTGRGFYAYPHPAYQDPGFLDGASGLDAISTALSVALVTNALCIAAKDVAEPEVIDRAWTVGTSLDTGPFAILEQMGVAKFLQALAAEELSGRLVPAKARIAEAYLQKNQGAN